MTMIALPEATAETYLSGASIRYSPGTDDLRALGAPKFSRTVGSYVNCENHEELVCALDAAGVPTYEVQYRGSRKTQPVSFLGQIWTGYPVCGTPVVLSVAEKDEKKRRQTAERGIVSGWFDEKIPGTEQTKRRSRVSVMVYLQPAVQQSCYALLRLSLKGYQSDCLLQALSAHSQACLQAEKLLGRKVAPYQLGLTFGVGEQKEAGSGETAFSFIPLICTHPRQLTKAYAQEHLAPAELSQHVEQDWPAVCEWATSAVAAPPQKQEKAPVVPTRDEIAGCSDPALLDAVRLQVKKAVDVGTLDVDAAVELEQEIDERLNDLLGGLQ
jgi:hypothetical protein